MFFKRSIVALIPALVLCLPSCQKAELDDVMPALQESVFATVPAPVNADSETKGISVNSENKAIFEWVKDVDKINVFSSKKGESMIYSVKEVSSETPMQCSFLVEDFALKTGNTYYAFYPSANTNDPSIVPIDYTTQRQYALDDDSHLPAYSYMVTAPVEASESGANFAFTHKSGWITFKILAANDFTAEKIILSTTTQDAFITKGAMNVVTGTITPTKTASQVVLYLGEPEEGLEIKGGVPTRAFMALNAVKTLDDVKVVLYGRSGSGQSVEIVKEITESRTYSIGKYSSITLQEVGAVAKPAKVGDVYYATIAEAVAVAQAGDIVEIVVAGTYTVPNLPKNISIKGGVPGVVFDCVGTGSIAAVPNGATFEDVAFNFGQNNYHGFQHAGTINMNGCTLNGKLFSYGDMNFNGCIFNQAATDYNMWCYGEDLTYTDCVFNSKGKFLNVYNEGNGEWKVSASGCTFNSDTKNKAALNIKASCGATNLGWDIIINNCSVNDEAMFPAAQGDGSSALFVGSPLWQVDDRTASSIDANIITVTVDDVLVYPMAKPVDFTASEVTLSTTADLVAFERYVNGGKTMQGQTVKLGADIDLQGIDWKPVGNVTSYPGVTFAGTFDGCNHTVSNMTTSDNLTNYASAGFFGSIMGKVKNLTLSNVTVTSTHYAGAVVGYTSANNDCIIENCHVKGGTITSTPELIGGEYDNGDKVGGIIGYIVGGVTVTSCSVEDVTITAYRDLGGIVGCATGTAVEGVTNNTVKNSHIVQDNTNGYKTSVNTYGEIVGRHDNDVPISNTATDVILSSK